jgi:hypothetical protein
MHYGNWCIMNYETHEKRNSVLLSRLWQTFRSALFTYNASLNSTPGRRYTGESLRVHYSFSGSIDTPQCCFSTHY